MIVCYAQENTNVLVTGLFKCVHKTNKYCLGFGSMGDVNKL